MPDYEACGNCRFFCPERSDLCVRFPPPQQAIVRTDDWCGEYEPHDRTPARTSAPQQPVRSKTVAVTTKQERLRSFTEIVERIK